MTSPDSEKDQFSVLGDMYEGFSVTPFRRYLEVPSVFAVLGDITGKAVFDLGCGAGDYTRWLRQQGASRVAGYDISAGMIEHARERERRSPLGIEYYLRDVPPDLDHSFDVVLSVYAMPYAVTMDQLQDMCALAARMTRPDGRLVTLPVHPDFCWDRPAHYERYGMRLSTPSPPADGDPVYLRLSVAGQAEDIIARYWSREALEQALVDTGFEDIRWEAHHVTAEGIAAHGEAFWKPYMEHPHAAIISARRTARSL